MLAVVEAHLGSAQVSRVIYGSIIGLALIVGLQRHPPPPGVVAATLLGTAIAVGLAELYAELVGIQTRTRRRVRGERFWEVAADVGAVGVGIAFPAVFFLLSAAGAMEVETAFDIAKWSGLGLICFYGYCAGRLTGAGVAASLMQALAVGAIGGLLIALKALVH